MKHLTDEKIFFIIIQLLLVVTLTIFSFSMSEIFFYSTERLLHTPTDVKLTAISGLTISLLMIFGILVNVVNTFKLKLND